MLIPIDPNLAVSFSRGLTRLLRPEHLRDEHYITDLFCGIIEHPQADGSFATWPLLDLPEWSEVPIHLEADGAEIAELLDIFVANNALTEAEASGIKSGIIAAAGTTVSVASFVPTSWTPYIMTAEQATAAGYFEA